MSNNVLLTFLVLSENAKRLHTAQKSSKIIESDLKTASSNQSVLVCVLFGGVCLLASLCSRLSSCLLALSLVFLVCVLVLALSLGTVSWHSSAETKTLSALVIRCKNSISHTLEKRPRDLAKASKRVAKNPFFGKFYLMWSKECVKTTTML